MRLWACIAGLIAALAMMLVALRRDWRWLVTGHTVQEIDPRRAEVLSYRRTAPLRPSLRAGARWAFLEAGATTVGLWLVPTVVAFWRFGLGLVTGLATVVTALAALTYRRRPRADWIPVCTAVLSILAMSGLTVVTLLAVSWMLAWVVLERPLLSESPALLAAALTRRYEASS